MARGKLVEEGLLAGALRFLEHFGIGGDRSIGKGVFDICLNTFDALPAVPNANAQVCLSLYHATPEEALAYDQAIQADPEVPLYYELTDRFGHVSFRGGKAITKGPLTHFCEGSVFPLLPEHPFYGHNPVVVHKGAHDQLEHDIYQYGMAFMLPMHIPQS